MVTVERFFIGKKFSVYELDNNQSIINRMATVLNTEPKYIYFPDGIPEDIKSVDVVNVENLLVQIKEVDKVEDLYTDMIPKLSQQNLDFVKDIVRPFVIYNKGVIKMPEDFKALLLASISEEFKEIDLNIDTNKIWKDKKTIEKELILVVEKNKKQVKEQVQLFQEFDRVKEGIPHTDFELLKAQFEIELNISNSSLLNVFNHIILNETVPFATVSNFYKILKDFNPSTDWGISYNEAIIVKVLQKINSNYVKPIDYVDALIGINDKNKIEINMDLNIDSGNANREQMARRLLSTIKTLGNIQVENIRENSVKGIFYFPSHTLNRYVFADLVMNNPLFSSLLSIDESIKATKQKNSIYIHFTHPSFGKVNINISENLAVRGDPVLKISNQIKIGENYIRAKIREANDSISALKAIEMLSKLFVIYDREYKGIIKEYKKYIPNFGINTVEPIPKYIPKTLKDIAPEIFLPGYAKKCAFMPTIISDEEAKFTDKEVMVFPRPESGVETRNYVCNHPENIFPGLRKNVLENSDKYPYIPCCYKKNQVEIPGSIYRNYYYGESLAEKTSGQQDILKTNKFVSKDYFGELPDEIIRMFKAIDPNKKHKYVRRGVLNTKSSFLNCILDVLNIDNIFDLTDPDEIESYLYEVRINLATEKGVALCKQEMYDKTDQEIMNDISDPRVYFDPKCFINLLEETFRCNIILFNRDENDDGKMIIPNHTEAYYKNRRNYPYIMVFEHMGTESDHAKYPRCEIICRHITDKKEENIECNFPYNNQIGIGLHKVYEKLRKAFALNKYIPEARIGKGQIISQTIDSYGKCRQVNIQHKGEVLSLLTTPLQPFNVIQENVLNKLETKSVFRISSELGIIISGQILDKGVLKELIGIWGNVNVNIPVQDDIKISGVPEKISGLSYPPSRISQLSDFSRNEKIAKFTIEYMFWLYSKFIDGEEPDIESIIVFADETFEIDPYFEYKNINKELSMNSNMLKNGKLVVESEEEIKRLLYVLRLAIVRRRTEIIEYKDRKSIDNFYSDVTDFTAISSQVILEGENSVDNWIQEKRKRNEIFNRICPDKSIPYFFSNKNISSGHIYIAQNTDSFEKALDICQTWNIIGYNPGMDPEKISEDEVDEYTLYSYQSANDIIQYGKLTEYKVIGYKVGDVSMFTALLN